MSGRLGQATSVASYHLAAPGAGLVDQCVDCRRFILGWMGERCWGCTNKLLGKLLEREVS